MNVYEISFERAIGDQQFGECPAYEHRGRVLVGGTTTTYTLTGLQEFSTYFITVTAVNACGREKCKSSSYCEYINDRYIVCMYSIDNTSKLTVLLYTFNF